MKKIEIELDEETLAKFERAQKEVMDKCGVHISLVDAIEHSLKGGIEAMYELIFLPEILNKSTNKNSN